MIKQIYLKSLRSIWKNKKSFISGVFVLSVGLSVFIGMLSALTIFNQTVDRYQSESNFADCFAQVVAMPGNSAIDLTRIDGVADYLGVLEYSVDARLEGSDDLMSVRLVGLDDENERTINLYKYIGEPIASDNDIWLGKPFFDTHDLNVGDTIRLSVNGSYKTFTIRGNVISPEYLVTTPEGGTFADTALSTIGFVRNSVVENASGMPGMINNISIVLDSGITFNDVRQDLEDVLQPYGILNLIDRADHASIIFVVGQSNTIQGFASLLPALFLTVACAMMYIALKRFIEMERTEIGTLKALGHTNRTIVGGYIVQGGVAAIIGYVIALIIGWFMGNAIYYFFIDYLHMEPMQYTLDIQASVNGLLISIIVCLLAVFMGTREAIRIKPAEAMRAAQPKVGASVAKLDSYFFRLFFDTGGKYAIRSMFRNARRMLITVLSIAITFTLINILFAFNQYMAEMMEERFTKMEVSDATVLLRGFVSESAVRSEMNSMSGVVGAEAQLVLPVELEYKGNTKKLSIYGLDKTATLFNIFDIDGNRHRPDGGIILNNFNAEELGVSEGQTLLMHSPHIQESFYVEVAQVIEVSYGVGAYMDISELCMLFGSENIANMLLINVKDELKHDVQSELTDAKNVLWYNDNSSGLEFLRVSTQSTTSIFTLMIVVAVIICFAVTYNTSSISLGEKQREYATLRILGYQVSEVSEINTFEYVLMLIIGSVLGAVIAFFAAPPLSASFNTEEMKYSVGITLQSTMLAFVSCAIAVAVSCTLIRFQIKKFNMADLMKERE